MILFLNAVELDDDGLPSAVGQGKLSRYTVDFITSMRATVVSLGMYPPGSKTIANAVEKVSNNLHNVLETQGTITFSEINGMLLIEGQQLDERDRSKAPVIDFIASMMERNIQSITFTKKVKAEELVDFLVIMSKRPKELQQLGPIPQQMQEKEIKNIQLNERIYVATTQEEQEEMERRERMLQKMLADDPDSVDDEDLGELMEDKEQFNEVLKRLIIGEDENLADANAIDAKASQVQQMMSRSFRMLANIKDEEQRKIFKDGLAEVVANLPAKVLTRLYIKEAENPTEFSQLDIDKQVFEKLDRDKAIAITKNVIREVQDLKRNMATMSPEERAKRINAIKSVVKTLINRTMTADYFGEITELLQRAGLVKESVVEQLQKQAEIAKERGGDTDDDSGSGGGSLLINSDGTVNEDEFEKAIRNFVNIPNEQLPGVLSGMMEVIGEVVFHEKAEALVDNALMRLDAEKEFNRIYISLADFLERICQEFIFNENYSVALRIVETFDKHSDPNSERAQDQKKRALTAQEKISSDDINRMLLTVYQHGEEESRDQVGELMTRMGNRMLLAMLDLLKTTEDRSIRRNILNLLQQMGETILDPVIAELKNAANPWYVIRNMVLLLSNVGNPGHVELLQAMLAHEEARVRKETVAAIARLDPENARETVRDLLADKNLLVKRFVINLLGTMKDIDSVPTLASIVSKRSIAQVEEEEALQLDAVSALGKIGDPEVIPILLDVLKKEGIFSKSRTKTPEIRARAIFALANYPADDVKKAIKSASKDGNEIVSEAAKAVLPRM